jgi:hypothetical protein
MPFNQTGNSWRRARLQPVAEASVSAGQFCPRHTEPPDGLFHSRQCFEFWRISLTPIGNRVKVSEIGRSHS